MRVGVVFSGRQAAGGHNIVWGLHEFLKGTNSKVRLSTDVGERRFVLWCHNKFAPSR